MTSSEQPPDSFQNHPMKKIEPVHQNPPIHIPDPRFKWILMGIPICIFMTIFELDRALGGNVRSWAYVPEWAIFALFIIYMNKKFSEPQEPYDDSQDPPREID